MILILGLVSIYSCEEAFFHDEEDLLVIDGDEEIEQLMVGVYDRLLSVHDQSYFQYTQRGDDIRLVDVSIYTDPAVPDICSIRAGKYGNMTIVYRKLYKTIISVNRLVKHLETEDPSHPYLGDSYLIRAFCYFDLVRFFNQIPLILDTDVDYEIQLSNTQEVYSQIVSDLLRSIDILPESPKNADRRISKGTAKALLAEVYLTMAGYPLYDTEKYKAAAELSGAVMENAEKYQFSLVLDYQDLWMVGSNPETVFGINMPRYSADIPVTWEESFFAENHPWGSFGGSTANWSTDPYLFFGPELSYYHNFPNNYRKRSCFVNGYYLRHESITPDETYKWVEYVEIDPFDYVLKHCYNRRHIQYSKFINTSSHGMRAFNELHQIPLLRYAHTQLTYAESKARSGQLDATAYEAVNKIRRRANNLDLNQPSPFDLQPGLSTEAFLDSVVNERKWEFCLEPQGRWFDVVRLDLIDKVRASRHAGETLAANLDEIFPGESYFAKIPQEDLWLNPNLNIYEDE